MTVRDFTDEPPFQWNQLAVATPSWNGRNQTGCNLNGRSQRWRGQLRVWDGQTEVWNPNSQAQSLCGSARSTILTNECVLLAGRDKPELAADQECPSLLWV